MRRNQLVTTWLLTAAVAAIPATQMTASAEETSGPTKKAACALISCTSGGAKCGDIHAELSDPLIGKFSVTWYCYEPGGSGEDGGEDVI
jgi:hypothetical protein